MMQQTLLDNFSKNFNGEIQLENVGGN